MKFYKIAGQILASETPIPEAEELTANTTDGAHEKHVPVIEQQGDHVTVKVGSVEHPMLDVHYIEWIALATPDRLEIAYLKPGDKPVAEFACTGADDVTAYAYCNLHGLWKADA